MPSANSKSLTLPFYVSTSITVLKNWSCHVVQILRSVANIAAFVMWFWLPGLLEIGKGGERYLHSLQKESWYVSQNVGMSGVLFLLHRALWMSIQTESLVKH